MIFRHKNLIFVIYEKNNDTEGRREEREEGREGGCVENSEDKE